MEESDVIVVGAGVVGLTTALAMSQRGFSVTLIDAHSIDTSPKPQDIRVYAINQASEKLLTQLGVWSQLDSTRLSLYQHMRVWDALNDAEIEFDARMIQTTKLGYIIEESVIKQALLKQIKQQPTIHCAAHQTVNAIEETTLGIRLHSENKVWQAKKLLIADGANSPCRQLLNIPLVTWPYHQQAIVAWVSTEKAHKKTAYQVFNPEGPLAFLPSVDEYRCSIVWSTTSEYAQKLMEMSEEVFNKELALAFAHRLGAVKLEGPRHQFPLVMRHTQQYSDKHWILLGDAAHTIHPLAGLGLNVGLADVATWLQCLKDQGNNLLSLRTQRYYQRQRKYAVWQVIVLMESLKFLFTRSFFPIVTLRGLGLRCCNHLSLLKRWLIQQAAGF